MRWWVAAGLVVLGVAGGAAGIALPNLVAYLAGLVVLAAGCAVAAARRPGGRAVRTAVVTGAAVVPVLVGVAVPWIMAGRAASADVAWSVDGSVDRSVTAAGRAYLIDDRDHRLTVADAASGAVRWRASLGTGTNGATNLPVVGADGSVVEVAGGNVTRAWSANGALLWDRPPAAVRNAFLLAITAKTVVTADCEAGRAICRLDGVGRDGRVTWTRRLRGSDDGANKLRDLTKDVQIARRAPTSVAVRVGTPSRNGRARSLILDPDTGRTLLSRAPPAGTRDGYGSPYAFGDGVLMIDDPELSPAATHTCRWSLYRGARRVWTVAGGRLCDGPDGTGPFTIAGETRLYSDTFTLDLATGRHRTLARDEGRSPDDPALQRDLLGPEITVRRTADSVSATDAATGRHLWTRPYAPPPDTKAGDDVSVVDRGVTLTERNTSHNPFLHPNVRSGDDGLEWTDGTVRLTTLDQRTGRPLGTTVDTRPDDARPGPAGALISQTGPDGRAYLLRRPH